MIETILSVIAILVFVGVLAVILISPSKIKKVLSILFVAACTNSSEDTDVVIKRAANGNLIKLNFLGQQNNE